MKNEVNSEKMSLFFIILSLLIGAFFYFTYYILMKDYFEVNPFDFPYLIVSIYFAIAIILFPYAGNKVSVWLENKTTLDLFVTSKMSMPFAYIIAPFIFLFSFFQILKDNKRSLPGVRR